jgi:TolB-like protein
LRVVGRASSFQYKKRDADLRTIGQALGATHLIEGSVRKAGNRVRISAELVQADNGIQVWSENYDRELLLRRREQAETASNIDKWLELQNLWESLLTSPVNAV